jgi:kelch-like protein 2/3
VLKTGNCERQDLVDQILTQNDKLLKGGFEIIFEWVPAHVGILGNELADKYAKGALLNPLRY